MTIGEPLWLCTWSWVVCRWFSEDGNKVVRMGPFVAPLDGRAVRMDLANYVVLPR